jgi:hypothetical protein
MGPAPVSQQIQSVSTNRSGKSLFGPDRGTQSVMTVQHFAERRDKNLLETMALRLVLLFGSETVLLSTFMYPVISIVHKVQALHCLALGCAVRTSLHALWYIFFLYLVQMPITVAARFVARTVFAHSNSGIAGSNPIQGLDVCILCLCCSV